MNWFDAGGAAYARFRPDYPPALVELVAGAAPRRNRALDIGCGNGQLTAALAGRFADVLGVDPSSSQLTHVRAHPRTHYVCATAEELPVADHTVDLTTVAQAAHWFDLPRFYGEVRRVLVSGGAVALVTYGGPKLEGAVNDRFQQFYVKEIGPFWPAERALVDQGYRTLEFPFDEITVPPLEIRRNFTLTELLGYVATWSAARRARDSGREDLLRRFGSELAAAWGDPNTARTARWPVNVRLGTIG